MEPNVITDNHGICITCKGHTLVVRDAQSKPEHMAAVTFDKCVFEELREMCRMATHMVADMRGDRSYAVAVFLANLFGGHVSWIRLQLGGYAPSETEARR